MSNKKIKLIKRNGKWYTEDGKQFIGTAVVNGQQYHFNSDGTKTLWYRNRPAEQVKTDNVTLEGPPMKEVVVEGYRPIELHTFYPFKGLYPYTGHSEMYIPISNKVADEYGLRDADAIERGKQIVMRVNRRSTEHDYNLLTNNCADATLCYLNKMFGTKAKPWFFTTPGDVRDFALSSLRGKVGKKSKSTNSDTVYIPRTKNNADAMSRKALELFLEEHLPQNRIFHSVLGYQKQGGKFKWYLEQK